MFAYFFIGMQIYYTQRARDLALKRLETSEVFLFYLDSDYIKNSPMKRKICCTAQKITNSGPGNSFYFKY